MAEFKITYNEIYIDKIKKCIFIITRDNIIEALEDAEKLNSSGTNQGLLFGGYYTKIISVEKMEEDEGKKYIMNLTNKS